jgi:hypothetical protein
VIRGNVLWKTPSLWKGGVAGTQQGFWHGNVDRPIPVTNCIYEQNIMMTDNQGYKAMDTVDFSGTVVRNNLAYSLFGGSNFAINYVQMGGARDYNAVVGPNSGGVGPNGLHLDTVDGAKPNYTASDAHFVNGGPRPAADSYVDRLIPKTSSRMHWSHPDRTGPWERLREIVDQVYRESLANPVIPADAGWPVAPVWQKRFNDNGGVGTRYTGKFDAEGRNA